MFHMKFRVRDSNFSTDNQCFEYDGHFLTVS
jgi:hypothetical protein